MAAILIVEDDILICDLAGMLMHDLGHEIVLANDVDEALEVLRSSHRIDALFTDIYLKKAIFGGCELAQEAIQLRPNLRILYTTGNAVTDKLRAMFVAGSHFLRKPYTGDQLQESVYSMLAA